MLKPQLLQKIDCRIFEEGLDDLVLELGTGERRCVRTSKKTRYVSSEKHAVETRGLMAEWILPCVRRSRFAHKHRAYCRHRSKAHQTSRLVVQTVPMISRLQLRDHG